VVVNLENFPAMPMAEPTDRALQVILAASVAIQDRSTYQVLAVVVVERPQLHYLSQDRQLTQLN
jgi:hypothetical protein